MGVQELSKGMEGPRLDAKSLKSRIHGHDGLERVPKEHDCNQNGEDLDRVSTHVQHECILVVEKTVIIRLPEQGIHVH